MEPEKLTSVRIRQINDCFLHTFAALGTTMMNETTDNCRRFQVVWFPLSPVGFGQVLRSSGDMGSS